MKDLANPALIKLKGILFLLIGLLSAILIILETHSLKVGILLAIAIWCFCRFYYFAFYVIQQLRRSGLSLLRPLVVFRLPMLQTEMI